MFTFAHGFMDGSGTAEAATLVLHVATYNASTYLVGDETVSGTPTFVHTSAIQTKDSGGTWRSFGTNTRVVKEGRFVSDSAVYADNGSDVLLDPLPKVVYQKAATNYFINSSSPATQSCTVGFNSFCVVWLEGAGSVTVSGGGITGTATESAPLYFKSVGTASPTFTTSGTLTHVQVEKNEITGRITTVGSPVATDEIINTYPSANWSNSEGPIYVEFNNDVDKVFVSKSLILNDDVPVLYLESIGVGDNAIDNGDASDGTTGWTVYNLTVDTSGNTFLLTRTTTGTEYIEQAFYDEFENGDILLVEVDYLDGDCNLSIYIYGAYLQGTTYNVFHSGLNSASFLVTVQTTDAIMMRVSANSSTIDTWLEIDNISVKKIGKQLTLDDGTNQISTVCSAGEHEIGIVLDTTGNKMKLNLDGTYATEADYDNSFGTGNITVEADIREYKRKDESSYTAQQTILDGWMP